MEMGKNNDDKETLRFSNGPFQQVESDDDESLQEYEEDVFSALTSTAIGKSTVDPFDYCLKLKTGEVIRYIEATKLHSDWLHLSDARWDGGVSDDHPRFPRGIDVKISEIVWVMDAPYGS
jgi:hypothetical protein